MVYSVALYRQWYKAIQYELQVSRLNYFLFSFVIWILWIKSHQTNSHPRHFHQLRSLRHRSFHYEHLHMKDEFEKIP